jgi:hypothetical protein
MELKTWQWTMEGTLQSRGRQISLPDDRQNFKPLSTPLGVSLV